MGQAPDTPYPPYDSSDEYRPEPPRPPEPPAWQDGSIRIGIHTSIAGDIAEALETAHRLGANALQIFSVSPRMWPRAPSSRRGGLRAGPPACAEPAHSCEATARRFGGGRPRRAGRASAAGAPDSGAPRQSAHVAAAEAERFRARRAALGLGPLVIHDNYLINLASPERVLRARSIQALHGELVRALALGADFLVAHPGARRSNGLPEAIEDLAAALRQATRGLSLGSLRILLENTAGQGTALGASFAELKRILDACGGLPVGVCLDTAHLFAAGYDIRTADGLEQTLERLERSVGLARVFVIHVNDSKAPLGSRLDRHEHIGKGRIGLEAFRRLLNHPLLAGRAFILETPIDKPGDDRRNVRTLWTLVGVKPRQARLGGQARGGEQDGFPMFRGRAGSQAGVVSNARFSTTGNRKQKRTNAEVTEPQRTRRRKVRRRTRPLQARSSKRKSCRGAACCAPVMPRAKR